MEKSAGEKVEQRVLLFEGDLVNISSVYNPRVQTVKSEVCYRFFPGMF